MKTAVCCGIAADVKKAKEGGFHTVQSLIMTARKVGRLRNMIYTALRCQLH